MNILDYTPLNNYEVHSYVCYLFNGKRWINTGNIHWIFIISPPRFSVFDIHNVLFCHRMLTLYKRSILYFISLAMEIFIISRSFVSLKFMLSNKLKNIKCILLYKIQNETPYDRCLKDAYIRVIIIFCSINLSDSEI